MNYKRGWREVEIERYELGPVIGTGGFASVYRARDPRLDALVAVKVLADNWSADPSVRFRFGQEASLLRRVRSQRRDAPLIEVFDIDEDAGGRPYFVMSYADRGTLKDRMHGRPRAPGEMAEVIRSLASGMIALHGSGVIHRDLKPSNLLYVSTGSSTDGEQLLIGDLGLAKDQLAPVSALTFAGGSPGYMAPEQGLPQATISPQADVYSASVIVLELLTGQRDLAALELLPDQLAAVLNRGTATVPQSRQRTAEEWRTELFDALDAARISRFGGPGLATPTHPSRPNPQGVRDPVGRKNASLGTGYSRVRWIVGGLVAAIVVAALLVASDLFINRSDSVAIEGPRVASVGQTIVLVADVPDTGSYSWSVDGTSVDDQDLQLTPRSGGTLLVQLEHRDEAGVVARVIHIVDVAP